MFSTIKAMWKDARVDTIDHEISGYVERYERYSRHERYELTSAFDYTKSELENENGPLVGWPVEKKLVIAKHLRETALRNWKQGPAGATGFIILSCFIELQTIPGQKAANLVRQIAVWHERAVEDDINRDA